MPKKAKTIRIKDRKNTNEIKSINTNKDLTLPASSPAAGSDTSPPPFYPPPLEPELPDAEAAYDFDSQGADETLR